MSTVVHEDRFVQAVNEEFKRAIQEAKVRVIEDAKRQLEREVREAATRTALHVEHWYEVIKDKDTVTIVFKDRRDAR